MTKQFWIVLAVAAVLLGGFVFLTNQNKPGASSAASVPSSHTKGTSAANVTFVEYGDYECPVCAAFEPTVQQVEAKYGDRVVFQFRNLPLVSIHQNAFAGARAAEAASLQGKFWEMHDLLYQNQAAWVQSNNPSKIFDQYAQSLGLNVAKFDTDYASETVNSTINADVNAFNNTHTEESTPAFFLDGKRIDNSTLIDSGNRPSLDAFSKLLDTELAAKTKS